MEQRCVLCNKDISEEDINGAIDFDLWDEFSIGERKDTVDENGRPLPPESADPGVRWTAAGGWVHLACDAAYGSGLPPDAWWERFENNLRGGG